VAGTAVNRIRNKVRETFATQYLACPWKKLSIYLAAVINPVPAKLTESAPSAPAANTKPDYDGDWPECP
jgi:hypothetical protein